MVPVEPPASVLIFSPNDGVWLARDFSARGACAVSATSPDEALRRAADQTWSCLLISQEPPEGAEEFVRRWIDDVDGRSAIALISDLTRWTDQPSTPPAWADLVIFPALGFETLFSSVQLAIDRRRLRRRLFESEKAALIGNVTAGVLHELKNPLNNVLNGLERLLAQVHTDPAVLRWGGLIRRNSDLLRQSLKELLEGFRRDHVDEQVDLHALMLRAALYVLKGDVVYRHLSIERELTEDAPMVMGSSGHLLHLFLNLILNARQAMEGRGGRIVLRSYWNDPATIVVEVEDEGPGIAPEVLGHLFHDCQSTKPGGSGFGLVLCQQIVARHQGTITAMPGRKGALFRVTLPACLSADAEPRIAPL